MLKRLSALAVIAAVLYCSVFMPPPAEASAAGGSKYKNTAAAARETMWKAITGGHGSGASVAVMDCGKIVYSETFGAADRAKNTPVDRRTRFNIGSTSKMFVTAAVMMLVDEGKVRLDDPLVNYIPEFTMKDPRCKNITVRMLFNHSSGLPGTSTPTGYEVDEDTHRILFDCLKVAYLKHEPGAMSIYCNDGFTLAEILVEKVSGVRYMDFVTKRIFRPLGMRDSGPSNGELQPVNSAFYYEAATGKKHPHEVMMVYGAGGLSSTAEDMCRFGYSFCAGGPAILSKASLAEMRRTQPTDFSGKLKGPQMMEEMGWEYVNLATYKAQGVQVMSKGGNTTYNSSCMQIVPDEGIVVAVAISGQASGESLARPVLDGVMKDRRLAAPKAAEVKKPVEAKVVPAEMIASYEGYYASDAKIVTLKFDAEKKGFSLYEAAMNPAAAAEACSNSGDKNQPQPPIFTFVYDGEYFHDHGKSAKCYLSEVRGVKYIINAGIADYEVDGVMLQKLEPVADPRSLIAGVDGATWLQRGLKPYIVSGVVMPLVSNSIAGLPGYINLMGAKKIENSGFASIAVTAFRDQGELYVFEQEGGLWARMGIYLLSQESCAKKAAPGLNRAFIGPKNYNEWLKIEKGAILKFEIPEKGRLIVVKGETAIFDSVVDENREIYAPDGSYVFCAGKFGDVFKVNVR